MDSAWEHLVLPGRSDSYPAEVPASHSTTCAGSASRVRRDHGGLQSVVRESHFGQPASEGVAQPVGRDLVELRLFVMSVDDESNDRLAAIAASRLERANSR